MNAQYDAEMNALSNTVSDHAVQLIKQQYDFALLSATKYRYYPMGPYIMMQYAANTEEDIQEEYMMNPHAWTCSCIFRVTRLLPCRHIIYYRKTIGCTDIVPESILHPRWVVKNYKQLRKETAEPVELPYEDRKIPNPSCGRAKSQNEKFNELLHIGKQVADVGATWGTTAHEKLKQELLKVFDAVRIGQCPRVTSTSHHHDNTELVSIEDNSFDSTPGSQFENVVQSETVLGHINMFEATTRDLSNQDIELQQREEEDVVCVDLNERAESRRDEESHSESRSATQSDTRAQPKTVQSSTQAVTSTSEHAEAPLDPEEP
ncbi:hypothetical protein GN958_ATG11882 [Phytophthora infestans]|uniref:SWIM-type domain-containing protein n=1 Tax=Phytophthora infestans TaxID=4787 RepID=A0A8S9UCU8_PHYIN|nr:hypothetical protein GN958_ATG11882 [Phytophthora infestans]